MKIEIPLSGCEELTQYQSALLGLLNMVKIGQCDVNMRKNVKTVYALLSHMLIDNRTLVNNLKKYQNDDEQDM